MVEQVIGQIITSFEKVLIRSVEIDGQYTNNRGNVIGNSGLYRILLSIAEENAGLGKEILRTLNVFENECISGIRVPTPESGDADEAFLAFQATQGRIPQKGDRVSFKSHGNLCAPVAFSAGEGRYVIPTHENELDGINRDVILDYTNCSTFEWFAASGEAVATVAADVDVTKLPW